jgi:RNA polymerase sigma-70 factor, ECF subfamily
VNSKPHPWFGVTYSSLAELNRLTDEQLMDQLRAGANDALTILFERYHRLVFSIAFKMVRDRGEAEDVMQNVFLEVFRSVAQFDPAKGTTKVWFLQYAYHRAINRKQQLNARSFYSQQNIEDLEPFLSCEYSPSGRFTPGELKRLMQQGLETLVKPQKEVIELASFQGLSMKEIADQTGDSLSNVRHHYYRGLQKLRCFVTQSASTEKVMNSNN